MKINKIPNANGIPEDGFSIGEGGTKNLEGVLLSTEGTPNNILFSNADNKIDPNFIDSSILDYIPTLTGVKFGLKNTIFEFTITNYSSFRNYVAATTAGTVVVTEDKVYFTPNISGFVNFTLNNRIFEIEVDDVRISKPTILTPSPPTNLEYGFTFTSSAFVVVNATDTHSYSDWELSTFSDFSVIEKSSYGSAVNKTSWTVSGLTANTVYYARVRYKGVSIAVSNWSTSFALQTKKVAADTNVFPLITAPSFGALNQAVTLTVTASPFSTLGWVGDTHQKSDWELSTSDNFNVIFKSSYGSTVNKTSWPITGLNSSTTYYVRVRYYGVTTGNSLWSSVSVFKTNEVIVPTITIPSIIGPSPATGVEYASLTFTSSNFLTLNGSDTHASSDWELSTFSNFSVIEKSSYNSSVNKKTWTVTDLIANTVYYARVRYKGVTIVSSNWSTAFPLQTKVSGVVTTTGPVITFPVFNAQDQATPLTFTSSAFSTLGWVGDTHQKSDWQLSTVSNFSVIADQSLDSTTNKTSWNPGKLLDGTVYYVRVRYYGTVNGYSPWATVSTFTTLMPLVDSINTPSVLTPSPSTNLEYASVTFTSSAFSTLLSGDSHLSSDWELSTDANFNSIIKSAYNSTANKVSWTVTNINADTIYYVRVKYRGNSLPASSWSNNFTIKTKLIVAPVLPSPTILYPEFGVEDQPLTPTIIGSYFADLGWIGDTHQKSDWQLSTVSNFSTIVLQSLNSTANKTTWNPGQLTANTVYYVRVRYYGVTNGITEWSSVSTFKTIIPVIATLRKPTITDPNPTTDLDYNSVMFGSSGPVNQNGLVSHVSSDWELSLYADFHIGERSVNQSTTNKTSWTVTNLESDTIYYARVTYRGDNGTLSERSDTYTIITRPQQSANSKPTILTPVFNAQDQPTSLILTATPFSELGWIGNTHQKTDWQLSTVSNFSTIAFSTSSPSSLTSWNVNGLLNNTTYYVRARYYGTQTTPSLWSSTSTFKTVSAVVAGINTPVVLTPSPSTNLEYASVTFTSSTFAVVNSSATHEYSNWQLSKNSDFSVILTQSLASTTNKTSWTVTGLDPNTVYYVRVNYFTSTLPLSDWSNGFPISTKASSINLNVAPSITFPTFGAVNVSTNPTILSSAFSALGWTNDTHESTDWQLSTDSAFTNPTQVLGSTTYKTSITTVLPNNTVRYLRCRYKGVLNGYSQWSSVVSFTTIALPTSTINTPTITGGTILDTSPPISGTIISSPFAYTGGATLLHVNTDWQIATDINFTNFIINVSNSSLTTYNYSGLATLTKYYARVRYRNSAPETPTGVVSAWSPVITFTTKSESAPVESPMMTLFDDYYRAFEDGTSDVVKTVTANLGSIYGPGVAINRVVWTWTSPAPMGHVVNNSLTTYPIAGAPSRSQFSVENYVAFAASGNTGLYCRIYLQAGGELSGYVHVNYTGVRKPPRIFINSVSGPEPYGGQYRYSINFNYTYDYILPQFLVNTLTLQNSDNPSLTFDIAHNDFSLTGNAVGYVYSFSNNAVIRKSDYTRVAVEYNAYTGPVPGTAGLDPTKLHYNADNYITY